MRAERNSESTTDYLTPAEAARATGLSVRQLARLADAGNVAAIQPGKHRRYRAVDIAALIAQEPWEPAS